MKTMINKARGAFAAQINIWKTNDISNISNIRIFKSDMLIVLLYAVE